jgi:hypothetical protein
LKLSQQLHKILMKQFRLQWCIKKINYYLIAQSFEIVTTIA